jgi:hypothetical protein
VGCREETEHVGLLSPSYSQQFRTGQPSAKNLLEPHQAGFSRARPALCRDRRRVLRCRRDQFCSAGSLFARAEPATGTISSYQLHVRNSGLSEYCPLIEFTTKAGESFSYLGADCLSAPNASQVGQHVQLYYDPKNPNDNRTRGFGDEYTGLTLGVVGGVFFGALGVGGIVLGWGIAFLPGRLTAKSAADPAAQDEQHAARSAAAEAASFVKLKESLLDGGASEAEAEAQVEEKRRAVQEWKAKREGNNPDA